MKLIEPALLSERFFIKMAGNPFLDLSNTTLQTLRAHAHATRKKIVSPDKDMSRGSLTAVQAAADAEDDLPAFAEFLEVSLPVHDTRHYLTVLTLHL